MRHFHSDCAHQQNRCESLKSRNRIFSYVHLCVSGTLDDQFFADGDVNTLVQVMAAAWYILTHTRMADNDDPPPAFMCELRTVRPAVYAW